MHCVRVVELRLRVRAAVVMVPVQGQGLMPMLHCLRGAVPASAV